MLLEEYCDAIKIYSRHAAKLELSFTPKRHDILHLVHQMSYFGPIAWIGTWTDERYNGLARPIVQASHRMNLHARVLLECKRGLPEGASSGRRTGRLA